MAGVLLEIPVRSVAVAPFPVMSGPIAYGSFGTWIDGAVVGAAIVVPFPEIEKSEPGFCTLGGAIGFVVVPLEVIPGIEGGRMKSREVVIGILLEAHGKVRI